MGCCASWPGKGTVPYTKIPPKAEKPRLMVVLRDERQYRGHVGTEEYDADVDGEEETKGKRAKWLRQLSDCKDVPSMWSLLGDAATGEAVQEAADAVLHGDDGNDDVDYEDDNYNPRWFRRRMLHVAVLSPTSSEEGTAAASAEFKARIHRLKALRFKITRHELARLLLVKPTGKGVDATRARVVQLISLVDDAQDEIGWNTYPHPDQPPHSIDMPPLALAILIAEPSYVAALASRLSVQQMNTPFYRDPNGVYPSPKSLCATPFAYAVKRLTSMSVGLNGVRADTAGKKTLQLQIVCEMIARSVAASEFLSFDTTVSGLPLTDVIAACESVGDETIKKMCSELREEVTRSETIRKATVCAIEARFVRQYDVRGAKAPAGSKNAICEASIITSIIAALAF